MTTIWVYISGDGDHIGRQIGRASLADDPEEIRRLSQAIDAGNEVWKAWVLSCGGDAISVGGDEFRLRVGADHLKDLPELRTRYADAVGASVSIGIGTRMSEADKALLAAKLGGGDRIQLYGPEVEEVLAQNQPPSESEKIRDEYLTKAQEPALNPPSGGGGITGPSLAPAEAPASPVAEGSEHSENEVLQDEIQNAPKGPEVHDVLGQVASAQAQQDDADAKSGGDAENQGEAGKDLKSQVLQILKVIKAKAPELEQLQQQDPELYQGLTDLIRSMIAMARQVFGGGGDDGSGQQPVQKSEALDKVAPPGFSEDTMHKLKARYGEESAFKIAWAAHNKIKKMMMEKRDLMPGGKGDNARDQDFDAAALARGIATEMEEHGLDEARAREIAKDHLVEDPSYYALEKATQVPNTLQVPPRQIRGRNPRFYGEQEGDDLGGIAGPRPEEKPQGATALKEPPRSRLVEEKTDPNGFRSLTFDYSDHHSAETHALGPIRLREIHVNGPRYGLEVRVGPHEYSTNIDPGQGSVPGHEMLSPGMPPEVVRAIAAAAQTHMKGKGYRVGADFETGAAPLMQSQGALEAGKTGRHNVILPVGSQKDPSASGTAEAGKIKVAGEDGKTKWRSVRAGLVMAPDGSPVSSRNPGAK